MLGFWNPSKEDYCWLLTKFNSHPKESPGGAGLETAVLDLGLLGEVLGGLYRSLHALNGKEGCKVGSVGADHDEGEEPPHGSNHSEGDR